MTQSPSRQSSFPTLRPRPALGALLLVALSAAALGCGPLDEPKAVGPTDVNYWEKRKGNCEQILGSPQAYKQEELVYCMKVWETYRSVGDLSVSMRSMYAIAFSQVWYGTQDPYEKAIADTALARLCVKRHPMVDGKVKEEVPSELACGTQQVQVASNGTGSEDQVATAELEGPASIQSTRATVAVKDVSEGRRKKAADLNKKGVKAAGKKKWGESVDFYEQSLAQYEHYVTAKYNLICVLAVMGNDMEAMEHLKEMYTWDDSEVEQRLIKARSDEDLVTLRDDLEFKQMTGYFRLVLADGTGGLGVDPLTRIKAELEARRFVIADTRNVKNIVLSPEIWYRDGFKQYAEDFKPIIGAKKVRLSKINWETLDDVIIIWGQPEAANSAGTGQAAPIVQGVRAEGEKQGLDDLTKAVQDTKGSVDDAASTGTDVVDSVPKK